MSSILSELKRRNVFKAGVAYAQEQLQATSYKRQVK
jgi:hypothetical protein